MSPVRVVLVDDHTMFREGMASVLTSRGGDVEVVGQAPNDRDAIDLIERLKPDVVITQVEHHLKRAEEILAAMRSASPTQGSSCSPCSTTSTTCVPSQGSV